MGVTALDLVFALFFDMCCALGGESVQRSTVWHIIYSLTVVGQIYILVALIKIRHIYNYNHPDEETTKDPGALQSANIERSDVEKITMSSQDRDRKLSILKNILQPQNIIFIQEREKFIKSRTQSMYLDCIDVNGLERTSLKTKFFDSEIRRTSAKPITDINEEDEEDIHQDIK